MQFECPSCRAAMSANPPQPGRFVIKCPYCAKGFVIRFAVLTLSAEKAEAERETNYQALSMRAAELEKRLALAHRAPARGVEPPRQAAASFQSMVAPPGQTDAGMGRGASRPQLPLVPADPADLSLPPMDFGDDGEAALTPAGQFRGYEVLKRLGRGGMGSVYLARQVSLDRTVALKTLNPEVASDAGLISRFVREAYAAAQLTHHNVVQIYELGRDGGVNFFSMEYVHGGSLGDKLRHAGRLTADEAVASVVQAACGLRYAHDRGMVHRDIKPDNLMVNDDGVVKVADLGLVKTRGLTAAEDAVGGGRSRTGTGLGSLPDVTRAGSAMGSPSYMAPEQCRDATAVDHRADVYSLGCTLYALLAGRAPFQGDTAIELMHKHLSEPPPPLARAAPGVPADLVAVVERALAKDPGRRYQSMAEFISALKKWQQGQGLGVGGPTESQLSLFESQIRQLTADPLGQWAGRVGLLGPPVGVVIGLIALTINPVVGGVLLFGTLAATLSGFVTSGLLTGSYLFRKVREWAFGARALDWITAGAAVLLFSVGLYFSGLMVFGLVGLVLGIGAGVAYGYALAKPAHDRATEVKDELEGLAKRWRLAGMDEDDIRKFVAENGGDRWERVYELLYGYPAKVLARGQFAEQVAGRPQYAGWRDAVVVRLDAMIQQRKDAKAKKLLKQMEVARLKAEGVGLSEALQLADDAADDVVEQGKAIQAANADRRKKVNVREMMRRYERPGDIPRRKRPPAAVRVLKGIFGLPFDRRLRLVLGAMLVVAALMWVNQNTAVADQLKDRQGEQATATAQGAWEKVQPLVLLNGEKRPESLKIDWLPAEMTGLFDTINPLVAGLLVLLSALASRTGAAAVLFGAAVALVGHKLGIPIPDVGPLKPAHLSGLGGLVIGLVGFFLLGRK